MFPVMTSRCHQQGCGHVSSDGHQVLLAAGCMSRWSGCIYHGTGIPTQPLPASIGTQWRPPKYVRLANGWYAIYLNAFLLVLTLMVSFEIYNCSGNSGTDGLTWCGIMMVDVPRVFQTQHNGTITSQGETIELSKFFFLVAIYNGLTWKWDNLRFFLTKHEIQQCLDNIYVF